VVREVCEIEFRNLLQDVAEIYGKEEDAQKAMEFYEKAADLYSGEEANSTGNQCRLKVAEYAAELEQ
jgi:alpha-soluble NSF attachment protein